MWVWVANDGGIIDALDRHLLCLGRAIKAGDCKSVDLGVLRTQVLHYSIVYGVRILTVCGQGQMTEVMGISCDKRLKSVLMLINIGHRNGAACGQITSRDVRVFGHGRVDHANYCRVIGAQNRKLHVFG